MAWDPRVNLTKILALENMSLAQVNIHLQKRKKDHLMDSAPKIARLEQKI